MDTTDPRTFRIGQVGPEYVIHDFRGENIALIPLSTTFYKSYTEAKAALDKMIAEDAMARRVATDSKRRGR